MNRVLQRCVLLTLAFVLSTWLIYSLYFNSVVQDDAWKQIEDKRIKKEFESNPKDIRYVLAPIRKRRKEDFGQTYENDQEKVKYVKRFSQNEKTVERKRTKIETISNDIAENGIYPLDIRYIPTPIRQKHKLDLRQTYEKDQKYVKELKRMLQVNETTRDIKFEEDFLRTFITSTNYKIDEAFWKIQNYLQLRKDHNYFFHNMNFDFTQNPAYRFVTILPHRPKDGSATILFELGKWNPDDVPLEHLKKIMFIIYIQALRNPVTQASGLNIMYDFLNAGFRHIMYGTPQNLFLLHHASFELVPAKYLGIHLVNLNVIGNLLVTLSKPFLPEFIKSLFYTHSSVRELHDFFPTSMLPAHYGGNLTDYYSADWIREANKQHGDFPAGGQKNIF